MTLRYSSLAYTGVGALVGGTVLLTSALVLLLLLGRRPEQMEPVP